MAKKKDLKLDEFGFDSSLDFDMPEFGSPHIKKDRSPMIAIPKAAAKGFKEAATSPALIRDVIKKALPAGYGSVMDLADETTGTIKNLYNDTAREIKPAIKDLKKVTKKIIPVADTVLPKKMSEKIKKWAASEDDVNKYAQLSADAQRETGLMMQMGDIFKYQAETELKRAAEREANDNMQSGIMHSRHKDQMGQLDAMRISLQQLASYQHKVESGYQRKSLELQFRHYFVAQDTLFEMKRFNAEAKGNLEGIVKNTGLPEYQKLQKTERLAEVLRNKFIDSAADTIYSRRGQFVKAVGNKLAGNYKAKLNDFMQNFRMGMDAADQAGDAHEMMASFGQGGTAGTYAAHMAGSMAAETLGHKLGKKARGLVGKIPGAEKYGNKALSFTKNLPQHAAGFAKTDQYDDLPFGIGGVVRSVKDAILGTLGSSNSIQKDTLGGLDEPAHFTRHVSKSITEIIPGYLSRIYHELQVARTGNDKADLLVYDYKSNRFSDRGNVKSKILKDIVNEDRAKYVKEDLNKLVDKIFADREKQAVTPEQKIRLDEQKRVFGEFIYNDNLKHGLGSVGRLSNPDTYQGPGSGQAGRYATEFADIVKDRYANDVNGEEDIKLQNEYGAQGAHIDQSLKTIQEHVNRGNIQILEELGIVKADGTVDMKKIHDLHKEGWRASPKSLHPIHGHEMSLEPMEPHAAKAGKKPVKKADGGIIDFLSGGKKSKKPDTRGSKGATIGVRGYKPSSDNAGMDHLANGGSRRHKNVINRRQLQGGYVRGPGTSTSDSIGPVMLSDKEYVLPADTVNKVGKSNLDGLIKHTHQPTKDFLSKKPDLNTMVESIAETLMRIEHTVAEGIGIGLGIPGAGKKLGSWLKRGLHGANEFSKKGVLGLGRTMISGTYNVLSGYAKNVGKVTDLGTKALGWGVKTGIKGVGWAAGKINPFKQKVKDMVQDVFVGGEGEPRLLAWKMAAGHYIDKTTGKVIKKYSDIKGDIVDKADPTKILVRATELKDMFVKSKTGSLLLSTLGLGFNVAKGIGNMMFGGLGGVFTAIPAVAKFVWKHGMALLNQPQDIYVKGKTDPVLIARTMRSDGYRSMVSGHVIHKPGDIDGAVEEFVGGKWQVALTTEEYKSGILDRDGKPIKTGLSKLLGIGGTMLGHARRIAKKAGDIAFGAIGTGFRAAKNLVIGAKDLALHGLAGMGGSLGQYFGKFAKKDGIEVSGTKQTNKHLSEILAVLKERLPQSKRIRTGSFEDEVSRGLVDGEGANAGKHGTEAAAEEAADEKGAVKKAGGLAGLLALIKGGKGGGKPGEEHGEGSGTPGWLSVAEGGGLLGLLSTAKAKAWNLAKGTGKMFGRGAKNIYGLGKQGANALAETEKAQQLKSLASGKLQNLKQLFSNSKIGTIANHGMDLARNVASNAKGLYRGVMPEGVSKAESLGKLAGRGTRGIMNIAGKGGSYLKSLFGSAKTAANLEGMGGFGADIAKAGESGLNAVTKSSSLFGKAMPMLKSGGKLLGKIAAPLQAIMTSGQGAMDEANGKHMDSIKDVINGMLPEDRSSAMSWIGSILSSPITLASGGGRYIGNKINKGYEAISGGGSIGGDIFDLFHKKYDPNAYANSPEGKAQIAAMKARREANKAAAISAPVAPQAGASTSPAVDTTGKNADTEKQKALMGVTNSSIANNLSPAIQTAAVAMVNKMTLEQLVRFNTGGPVERLKTIKSAGSGKATIADKTASSTAPGAVSGVGANADKATGSLKDLTKPVPADTAGTKVAISGVALPANKAGQNPSALDCIRYKTYGLVKMDVDKVSAINSVESFISKSITFKGTTATWTGNLEDAVGNCGAVFGVAGASNNKAAKWCSWFNGRFLSVYLNYITAAATATNAKDINKAVTSLKPVQKLEVAKAIIAAKSNGGRSVWKADDSPWEGYDLNTDPSSVEENVNVLKQESKQAALADKTAAPIKDGAPGTPPKVPGSEAPTFMGSVKDTIKGYYDSAVDATSNAFGKVANAVTGVGALPPGMAFVGSTTGAGSGLRGIRNNNPGNINFAHQPGAVLEDPPKDGSRPRFAAWKTMEEGCAALAKQLMRYVGDGFNTIYKIINRYAPASDNNNTSSYMASVAKKIGIGLNDTVDINNSAVLKNLMMAIVTIECGARKVKEQCFDDGIALALGKAKIPTSASDLPGIPPKEADKGATQTTTTAPASGNVTGVGANATAVPPAIASKTNAPVVNTGTPDVKSPSAASPIDQTTPGAPSAPVSKIDSANGGAAGGWDVAKAVSSLNSNACSSSQGKCAEYVRKAVEAGGNVRLNRTPDAKNYGKSLLQAGFQIASGPPKAGDVAIIQPIEGHPHGHATMFNGTHWVSDFPQQHGYYPSAAYREAKPPVTFYRKDSAIASATPIKPLVTPPTDGEAGDSSAIAKTTANNVPGVKLTGPDVLTRNDRGSSTSNQIVRANPASLPTGTDSNMAPSLSGFQIPNGKDIAAQADYRKEASSKAIGEVNLTLVQSLTVQQKSYDVLVQIREAIKANGTGNATPAPKEQESSTAAPQQAAGRSNRISQHMPTPPVSMAKELRR